MSKTLQKQYLQVALKHKTKMVIDFLNKGTVNKNIIIFSRTNKDQSRTTMILYYSYSTIIAYSIDGILHARENSWSVTTGKFLNELQPNKKLRIKGDIFDIQAHNDIQRFFTF